MYVCPVCEEKYFSTEEAMRKHFLSCWKKKNPYHQSTPAVRIESIERQVNSEIMDFFNSFQKE